MVHYMHLKKKPYNSIYNGEKTIELRLYDEKRKLIKVGDEIVFSLLEDGEGTSEGTIRVKVTALHLYDSFKTLYASLPHSSLGYSANELASADYKDMEAYYSVKQQSACGVVGIEFAVISK